MFENAFIDKYLKKDVKEIYPQVGVDPFLIKASKFQELTEKLQLSGHKLVSIQQNLVDKVWKTRPEPKLKELETLDFRFSGTSIITRDVNRKITQ